MKLLMPEYRIVEDNFAGYEVQARRWWWPFWVQCAKPDGSPTNTHTTPERARAFAQWHAMGSMGRRVVEYLGREP